MNKEENTELQNTNSWGFTRDILILLSGVSEEEKQQEKQQQEKQ